MPLIKFSGVTRQLIEDNHSSVIEQLAKDFDTSIDNITLEVIESMFFGSQGASVGAYPFVEICSFRREQTIEQRAAKTLHNYLSELGYCESDIYYNYLSEDGYYLNGELL